MYFLVENNRNPIMSNLTSPEERNVRPFSQPTLLLLLLLAPLSLLTCNHCCRSLHSLRGILALRASVAPGAVRGAHPFVFTRRLSTLDIAQVPSHFRAPDTLVQYLLIMNKRERWQRRRDKSSRAEDSIARNILFLLKCSRSRTNSR